MQRLTAALAVYGDISYLLVRLMLGIILAFHGYQKLFAMGIGNVSGFFGKIGVPLPELMAPIVSILEFGGGILVIVGAFSRILGAVFTIQFIFVTFFAWVKIGKGYGGSELELLILFTSFMLATHGAGKYSVDAKRGW